MQDTGFENIFRNKGGIKFPSFDPEILERCKTKLWEIGVTPEQVCEAASYSMAMVVRYALGLTGQDSRVAVLACDTLSGWVALATARHLINSGATAEIIVPPAGVKLSSHFERQLKPLRTMRASFHDVSALTSSEPLQAELLQQIVSSCHNLIWGTFGAENQDWVPTFVERLNDLSTPVHCIECPPGIDPSSGKKLPEPLYASSTLSLGAPLSGLFNGSDCAGRHYLCDVSFTSEIYSDAGFDLSPLFAEQPVVQIFPEKEDNSKEPG